MAHSVVPEAEEILDQEFRVLDKGFVRLVDYLGGDERIVQSARVSYGAGTKTFREDRGLIRYLMRNEHSSPFEQVVLTFHVKVPIFVARQWIRHRTARVNEISGRYSVMTSEFYVPEGQNIALQSENNRQGREADAVTPEMQQEIAERLADEQKRSYGSYEKLLDEGLARELARINLPLSLYTEMYWQIDLHNLFHFLKLRMDNHAQYEIRAYADTMFDIAKRVSPAACEAFTDYVVESVRFSGAEAEALRSALGLAASEPAVPPHLEQAAEAAGITGKALSRFLGKLSHE
ncbi:MAG: FAD-dependent thymidylate synthase [Spirochaetes bacterium]|jgi:thymidylate synthase (FAD)|nr:FAD-dependent thymidylate synthase [Spirochaetota bacterium]